MIIKFPFPKSWPLDAMTIWPFILIRAEQANNAALIKHEEVHYAEQWKWLVIFWWLAYLLSRRFRLNAEARAYAVQIDASGLTLDQAADYLTNNYRLRMDRWLVRLTIDQAMRR